MAGTIPAIAEPMAAFQTSAHLTIMGLCLAITACGDSAGSAETGAGGEAAVGGEGTGAGSALGGASEGGGGQGPTGGSGSGGASPQHVLIAQGHVGRTMLSCDDGQTWVADRSDDASLRCDAGVDCEHHVGSATGLVVSDGYASMSNGWGTPGTVRRSADGQSWEVVLSLDFPFASIAGGPAGLMGATPRPWLSTDAGAAWAQVPEVYLAPPLRQSAYLPQRNRYVLTSEGNGLRVFTSDDLGQSFQEAATLPSGCMAISIASGNGALVMQHAQGGVCRSGDAGETWSVVSVDPTVGFRALDFVAGRFVLLAEGQLFESDDGATWSSSPSDLDAPIWDLVLGHNEQTGTLVAAAGAYESQRYFRSADGLAWTEVSGPSGHPLRRFVSGSLAATACSP
ncbi:MAG: hypothetical protein JNK04_20585 [Myxococcales bacterium]|nr:hypothetical protein [Myxococcales bacterium]